MKAMIQMVDRQTVRRMVQPMKIQVQKMRTAQPVMMQIREKLTVQPIKIQIQQKSNSASDKKQKEMTVHRKTIQTEMLRQTAVRQRTVSQMK